MYSRQDGPRVRMLQVADDETVSWCERPAHAHEWFESTEDQTDQEKRGFHLDSFASTLAEESVPKDASLLEIETFPLEVHPFAMVSLSAATSMTVEQWVVV